MSIGDRVEDVMGRQGVVIFIDGDRAQVAFLDKTNWVRVAFLKIVD